MHVISLYLLLAGYVRRLRCRRRRAYAWWCRSSMRCACVAYKKQLSQGLFFAVFLILQSSERRLFSKTVFFSNGRFGSCLLEPQTGASPGPPSLAIFFLRIGFRRCSAFFLSFLFFFLYYVIFFAEARGIFVDGVKVCLSLDCVEGGFRFCS